MSFKCFISFFMGIGSLLLGIKFYQWYGNILYIAIIIVAGFIMAQVICYSIHQYMKERHDYVTKVSKNWFEL